MELEFIDLTDIDLKFARGDQFPVDFKIKGKTGNYLSSEDVEDIIVTCRKFPDLESDMLFQKKLSNGFVEYLTDHFEFFILTEDTNKLEYGVYGFDIKIVTESEIKTFTGHINVADEYTVGVVKKNFYLEDLEITPSVEEQVFNHESSMGYDTVTVNAVTSDIDDNIRPEFIKKGITILGVTGTLESSLFIVVGEMLIAQKQTVLDSMLVLNQGKVREEMLIL